MSRLYHNVSISTLSDIPQIFSLYAMATAHQQRKGTVQWPTFSQTLVETEINDQRQWHIKSGDILICVWATTFDDPKIWEEKNADPAVYIHRIATHQDHRGHQYVKAIVAWASEYAKLHNKRYIRLDTCGENHGLIQYYQSQGFDYLGMHKLNDYTGLPLHYQGADVCFFEIDLER